MRRATGITLVLLGGGLAAGLSTCGPSSECREARAAGLPEAEQICRTSSNSRGSSYSSRGSSFWSSVRSSGTSFASSVRGGFGGTASAHASGGG